MKKILFFIICVLSVSQIAYSQTSFLMEYEMEIGAGKSEMKTTNKMWQSAYGIRVENEMNIPGYGPKKTVMLMPVSTPNLMYSIDESKKSYREVVRNNDSKEEEPYTIEIVGQEKIGNYNCTHAKIKTKDQVMDVWTTKDIEGYKEMSNHSWMQGGAKKVNNAFSSKELEGVMVRMKNANKEESFTMNLVKFEKGNFPQSMFEVPADYKKEMSIDPAKMKNMTPEERQKMVEEMMKQYGK